MPGQAAKPARKKRNAGTTNRNTAAHPNCLKMPTNGKVPQDVFLGLLAASASNDPIAQLNRIVKQSEGKSFHQDVLVKATALVAAYESIAGNGRATRKTCSTTRRERKPSKTLTSS